MEKSVSLSDICLYDTPGKLDKLISVIIIDDDYRKTHNARISLVKMGKTILPQLHKLAASENGLIRIQAAKLIQIAADERSINVMISLLNDNEFDIRWTAAAGLIKIGRKSIAPLLKAVRNGRNSLILNKRAHQVLSGLLSEEEKVLLKSLMQSLDNYHGLNEIAAVEALNALKHYKFN